MSYQYIKTRLFKAVIDLVKGINPNLISKDVRFPKIVLHSWVEGSPIDKDSNVREVSFVIECYGNQSYEQVQDVASEVSEALLNGNLVVENAEVIAITPESSEEIEEEDNNNIVIYRQLNRIVITIKQL